MEFHIGESDNVGKNPSDRTSQANHYSDYIIKKEL